MPRSTDTRNLHPVLRDVLHDLDARLFAANIPLQLYEAGRSPFRQAELYAIGRGTGTPGKHVTRARAWSSFHQWGMAADYVFKINGNWTWDEPTSGMWSEYQGIATGLGLRPLSFEKPHVEWPWPLSSLQAGKYPEGGDADWRDWLETQIESWGQEARVVGGITHPAAPPLLIDRPAVA